MSEAVVWAELAPFMAMQERTGVKALVEYVVSKEHPSGDVDLAWLGRAINSSLRSCRDEELIGLAGIGLVNQVSWCDFLEPDVRQRIERTMQGSGE